MIGSTSNRLEWLHISLFLQSMPTRANFSPVAGQDRGELASDEAWPATGHPVGNTGGTSQPLLTWPGALAPFSIGGDRG